MAAKLAHIAIEAQNTERAINFYQTVMGWEFVPWGPPNFYHIKGAGIHGALQERQAPPPEGRKGIECTFAVRDIEAAISQVLRAGGAKLGEPYIIEKVGALVHVQDTEQNEIILMQYDENYAREIGIAIDEL